MILQMEAHLVGNHRFTFTSAGIPPPSEMPNTGNDDHKEVEHKEVDD